jgi:hypothetical protein
MVIIFNIKFQNFFVHYECTMDDLIVTVALYGERKKGWWLFS